MVARLFSARSHAGFRAVRSIALRAQRKHLAATEPLRLFNGTTQPNSSLDKLRFHTLRLETARLLDSNKTGLKQLLTSSLENMSPGFECLAGIPHQQTLAGMKPYVRISVYAAMKYTESEKVATLRAFPAPPTVLIPDLLSRILLDTFAFYRTKAMAPSIPDFDTLPPVKDMPAGCAWGIFDKEGKKDVFGCLNKITPEIMLTASSEIKEGVSVSLKSVYFSLRYMVGIMNSNTHLAGVEFNTQCSSQWDSLCHFYHQGSESAYNGCKPSTEDLVQDWGAEDKEMALPTLNHWHERGGLVGRGVLIDFKAYAEEKGITFDPFGKHAITTTDLEEVAKAQGVDFKQGDVFILRTGYTEVLERSSAERQDELMATKSWAGIEQTKEAAKWFWNKGFSAVASDNIGFEAELGDGAEQGESPTYPVYSSGPFDHSSPPSVLSKPLRPAHW
ncbi:hypothetical protein B7463_g7792, partial [Scytalidium lignicola]